MFLGDLGVSLGGDTSLLKLGAGIGAVTTGLVERVVRRRVGAGLVGGGAWEGGV